MKNKWNAIGLGGLLTLSFLVTKPVMADEWNKKTEFQFNAPVEIPGRVLTPGRYVFEIAESQTERSMVEVFSEDSNGKENLIATLMAIPDRTLNTPDRPLVHFEERGSEGPEAIRSWFYSGEDTGWKFVYPKQ